MDKKKIISSITLAGMLATSVAGSGVFAAETSDPATKALGEYSKLITGKVAVPFILQSETDRVTGKDMKVAYPGKTITVDDDAVLKTGDVVNVNGEARTIVIYGDVNSDGKINIMDAVTVLNHVKGKTTLTDAQFAAADLNNNGSLNILEAVGVLNVVKGKADYANLATAPKAEVSKVTNKEITSANSITLKFDLDASKYTYSIRDNKAETDVAISKVEYDADKKEATLTTGTALVSADDQTYTLTIKDKDGNVVSSDTFKYVALAAIDTNTDNTKIEGDFAVINSNNQNSLSYRVATVKENAVATTVVVTLKDSAGKEVTGTATLPANAVAVSVNNFSGVANLKDGTINVSIKITDENGNMVEKNSLTVKKDTEALAIADITTTRTNQTVTATVTMKNGATVANEYFMVKKASESAPTASEVVAANKTIASDLAEVKLTEDVEYTIYVVAVNANGVKSEMASASIAKATASKLEAVTSVAASTTVAGEFTWEDTKNTDLAKIKGYKVILYTDADDAVAVKETTETKINMLKEIKEYAQENKTVTKYKVGVIAIGANSDVANSAEAKSTTYTTSALTTPTATLSINADTNHQILTWGLDSEATFYNVNVYKYDENGVKADKAIKTVAVPSTKSECDLTEAMKDLGEGKYAVTVNSLASTDSTKVDSEESTAVDTYNVKAPSDLTLSLKDNDTVTVSFSNVSGILTADKASISYELYYGKKPLSGDINYTKYTGSISKVESLNTTDIDLDKETTYSMYVLVKFGATEIARTDAKEITTVKAPLDMTTAKKVVATWDGLTTLSDGDISYNGDKLVVGTTSGNQVYTSNDDTANYSAILNVLKVLSVGDTIKEDAKGQITVEKTTGGNSSYGTTLKDVDLVLDSSSAVTISGTIKSVSLATTTKADLSYATVTEKVTVKASDEVNVKAGTVVSAVTGTVTINGIKVTLAGDTKITATATGLEIAGSEKDVAIVADDDATINFTGIQSGKVSLTENDADKVITILATNPLAELDVVKGNVNISDVAYSTIKVDPTGIIKTNKEKTIKYDDMTLTIKPTSGVVTVNYTASKNVKVSGIATIEFKTNEDDEIAETNLVVDNSQDLKLDATNKVTLTNVQGSVTYSVDSEKTATVVMSGDVTLVEAAQ